MSVAHAETAQPRPTHAEAMGRALHAWARSQAYSQDKVADLLGINQTTVHRIYKGKASIGVDVLRRAMSLRDVIALVKMADMIVGGT